MALRDSWDEVIAEFELSGEYIHLATSQFIASHPRMVRMEIERFRKAIDANPVLFVEENEDPLMEKVRKAAASYLKHPEPDDIALTDSTTLGLGMLYTGLPIGEGNEVVTTNHEHYSQREALYGACQRNGVKVSVVEPYDGSAAGVDPDDLVKRMMKAVTKKTRAMAVTWVHSDTGLKFPIAQLGLEIEKVNAKRDWDDRIRLCVDGTHGFGIETDAIADLHCHFFVCDTHKWMYGPRGTGLIWGRSDEWCEMLRVVPSFTEMMDAYSADEPFEGRMNGRHFTPGGFHSLEHRWAAAAAFDFHERIGRERIRDRVRQLNRQLKEGLAAMKHVTLHTPMSHELSAGITAFEVKGMKSKDAMKKLREQRIVTTTAPYVTEFLRFTPGIINTPAEVDAGLEAVRRLA